MVFLAGQQLTILLDARVRHWRNAKKTKQHFWPQRMVFAVCLWHICLIEHLSPLNDCLCACCKLMFSPLATIFSVGGVFDPVTPPGIFHLPFNPSHRRLWPGSQSPRRKKKTATVLNHVALNDAPSQPPTEKKITREAEHVGLMKLWLACEKAVCVHTLWPKWSSQMAKGHSSFLEAGMTRTAGRRSTIEIKATTLRALPVMIITISDCSWYKWTISPFWHVSWSQMRGQTKENFCVFVETEFIENRSDCILLLNHWRIVGDEQKACGTAWKLGEGWSSSHSCSCRDMADCGRRTYLQLQNKRNKTKLP